MALYFLLMHVVLFCSPILEAQTPNSPYFSWTKELKNELFHVRQYDKHARPVLNSSEQVIKVDVRFSFTRAVFNEKDGTLETNGWLGLRWVDSMLKWDPSVFGDMRNVKLISDLLWKPDIVVFNSVRGYDPMPPSQATLLHDGTVYYIPPLYLVTPCTPDLTKWPEGFLKCEIRFGAWTLDSTEILLGILENETKADLIHYESWSSRWEITETAVSTNSYFNCCNPYYQDVAVIVHLKRNSSLAEKIAIISSAGIWIIVLSSYWMSPNSIDRQTIGYSGFIGMILILVIFLWKLPTGKNVPVLLVTHLVLLLQCGSNCAVTMMNRRLLQRSPKSAPNWVRRLMNNRISDTLSSRRDILAGIELNQAHTPLGTRNDSSTLLSSSSTVPDETAQPRLIQPYKTCISEDIDIWYRVASLFDRLAFSIYLLSFILFSAFIVVLYATDK
ncbi:hypothetical protein GHT06_016883 [Daphnia sinensis]|uniref:Neurotransmitter-gated ion-channel ligand-binding domain-containing protein n=1 Tax=Daphnia sinensis TaxID=1820382 RepID=A0AAD5PVJ5_9CRUS|nr:hypothetical protein GHT06_016883 [Daphnia sinensis]